MLELIFRGFLEWIYVLIVEMWGFIADGLLDIMSLDFAYLQTHVPIIGQMEQLLLAVGWALLLGNLVFQALKSMAAGLGFEGEDPKLLFSRTFVFAFLLLASPQICRIGLDLTSNVMALLSVPDATDVGLVEEGIFGSLTAAWLMAMICSIIVMFKVLKLVIEVAERYVILAMLTICAPLAFAMGGSKNTASIFSGWCRMFGSMCLLMVTNLVCCKMLFSVVSTVPSGLDVLPWMVLIFAIVKVAHKSDAIITRIGLNPAITGGPGHTLPGMLAYTVARTAVNQVVKGVGGSGGGKTAKAASAGTKPGSTQFNGTRFGSGRFTSQSSNNAGGGYTYQNSNQQNTSGQSTSQQTSSQQSNTNHGGGRQSSTQQENTSHTSTQQPANGSTTVRSGGQTAQGGGRYSHTRRSSVPPATRRSPSYVPSNSGTSAAPGQGSSSTSQPGQAGTSSAPRGGAPSGPTGTSSGSSSTRATHSAAQSVSGSTVHSSSQSSAQTNVTVGRGTSMQKAPSTTTPRPPHPGGPNASGVSTPKLNKARSTRRDKPAAATKTPAAPTPGAVQSGTAGKPSRSTQRPADPTPRPGRNGPSSAAAPPAGRASSGPAPQEGISGHIRTTVERTSASTTRQERTQGSTRAPSKGASSSPARQEQRKAVTPSASTVKGGAPTVRPGGEGTAPSGKRAASPVRTATHQTKRANPVRRPPHNRGGNGHG